MIVLLLAALPVIMATLISIYGTVDDEPLQIVAIPIMTLIYTVIVPVIALVLAASSFGAEIEDGTAIYLLAKPISARGDRDHQAGDHRPHLRHPQCGVDAGRRDEPGRGLDPTGLVLGLTVGAALGAFLYSVLFLALGLVTKRGMLFGLTYLIVWEGALGSFFQGTRVLSVRQYMLAVADAITTVKPDIFVALLPAKTAYVMSTVVAVGVVMLCIRKLRRFEVLGRRRSAEGRRARELQRRCRTEVRHRRFSSGALPRDDRQHHVARVRRVVQQALVRRTNVESRSLLPPVFRFRLYFGKSADAMLTWSRCPAIRN